MKSESENKPSSVLLSRIPPHSVEAEAGVLGCLLLNPHKVGECIERVSDAEAFYELRHREVYSLLVSMSDAREHIDMLTVQQRLKDKQMLDSVGGAAYISSLPDTVPSAENLEYYLDIVLEKWAMRVAVQECSEAISTIYDSTDSFDETMDRVGGHLTKASSPIKKDADRTVKQMVNDAITDIETFHRSQGKPIGLETGFCDLDRKTLGLQPGDMAIIAGRPSMGKTSLAMNIAEHVACESRIPVGVFSLEMTGRALALRMLCSRARVNLKEITSGFIADRDFPKLTAAAGKIANAPLYIDESATLTILQLKAKARRMHQQHGIKLLVVDYLQKIQGGRREKREQEVADVSSGLKSIAKELSIPVIALCQRNRESEKDKKRKPRMADLRESGAIEQDADFIGILYRPESEEGDSSCQPVNLYIAKQRNGESDCDVELVFNKTITRFENAAKIDPSDLPVTQV